MKNFLIIITTFSFYQSWSQTISIPDATFKAYIVDNFDQNGDSEIQADEASTVNFIELEPDLGILSIKGVEHFENLSLFNNWGNDIDTLDFSRNLELEEILSLGTTKYINFENCSDLFAAQIHGKEINTIKFLNNTNLNSLIPH